METKAAETAFQVETLIFEGPMDLLLHLIEKAELEITSLAIAQVTNQFLGYILDLKEVAAEEVSSFLVVASRLVLIKSEALLPRPPVREPGEEDPGEELARQLIAYKRYKEIAEVLASHEIAGKRTYLRLAPPPRVEGQLDMSGITIKDLWYAALDVFSAVPEQAELNTVVRRPKVTIRQKIRGIVHRIRQFGRTRFTDILGETRSRIDIVVSFLAMLELVKRKRVAASQEGLFGEIDIVPAEEWDDTTDFELEFGE